MFHEEDDPSTPFPPLLLLLPPGVKITAMYARVPILPPPPNRLLLRRRKEDGRVHESDEHRFPDNFSPFVSCVRLGGRASPWQGATLVACAHPCDATCYETRNVTALADYLANEGFFRPLLLFVLSFGFEHASLQFSRREKRNANAMGEESWNNR